MKRLLLDTEFVFTPGTNQIDFSAVGPWAPERVYAAININTGKLIYAVNSDLQGFGGTFSGTILTYDSSNAGQANTDRLMIVYEDPTAVQNITGPVDINSFPIQSANVTIPGSIDVLGVLVSGNRNNQIEVNFETAPGATFITNTFTGSGAATVSNGHTVYSTGATGTSSAKGVSVATTIYRPAHELYCAFTAAFLNPTANSYQRIGLYNSNNGFFIGYEGASFGLTIRTGGVDTFIPQASFNIDTLTGAANSRFLRRTTPEALDTTLSNLFRIRFAWLGSANIYFETLSPNGEWVLFHNVRQPNTNYNPSIQNPDLPITIDVSKTSGATNVSIATACWGAGTTSTLSPITATLTDNTLANMTRAVITGVTTGGGGGYVNVKVNPSGALVADVTATLPDLFITGAATLAAGNNALLAVAGTGSTDTSGYRTAYVQVVSGATSGTFIFEVSNDNVNFQSVQAMRQERTDGFTTIGAITATSSNFIYTVPLTGRYFRLRIATVLNANITCYTKLSQSPPSFLSLPVTQQDGGNLVVSMTSVNTRPIAVGTGTDVSSATLTSTATTTAITAQSPYVMIQYSVTAATGSGSLDVVMEESSDFAGSPVNWNAIYSFPRITGTGAFFTPLMRLRGRYYRFVQTLSGTLQPTRIIYRLIHGDTCFSMCSVIDRTIVPNTLNSTSGAVYIANLVDLNLIVRCTAQTTAATIALQFSEDNSNWFTSGTTVTTVNGIAQASVTNQQWQYARAIVTSAGSGITLAECIIKGVER